MRILPIAAALLVLAPSLPAHDFWIQPSTHRPTPGESVEVRFMVGMQGKGEPVARKDERIVRFGMIGPGPGLGPARPELPIAGEDGADPAGRVKVDPTGQFVLVYNNTPSRIELAGEEFEAYLKEEGLDGIIQERADRGLTGKPARELYSRCAKALLDVRDAQGQYLSSDEPMTAAGKAIGFTVPVGLPLEIVPLIDPFQLTAIGPAAAPGADAGVAADDRGHVSPALQPLPLVLLLDGKPLEGALLRLVRLDGGGSADETLPTARTDAAGRAELALPGPGRWLIATVHMRDAAAGSDADYESLWASLTFEVPSAR